MIVFASCVADEERFRACAVPGLERAMDDDALFVRLAHPTSIFEAYNGVLDHVARLDGVEALVLLHEDVEILDVDFAAKVRRAVAGDDVAVAGVVGATDVTSIAWWEGTGHGHVGESRGPIEFSRGDHDVAVVDGLLLVLSPWAIRNLRFDTTTFTGWHGYDADICAQALSCGRRVVVFDTEVFHHTKGGFGDPVAWGVAALAWQEKWAELLGAPAPVAAAAPVVAAEPVVAAAPPLPSCSIVIPLYGRRDLTMQCLEHLARTVPHDVELVLVENGSPDDTRAYVAGLGGRATVLLERTNGGFARACNRGARLATGDVLVFMNNDTIPHVGWLEPLLRAVQEPGVVAAGPKLLFPDGTVQHAGVALFDTMGGERPGFIPFGPLLIGYQRAGDLPELNTRRDVPGLTGAVLCVRREAFDAAGGFDEAYWNGYEDVDLSLELRLRGGRLVYEPASVLVHLESGSGPERHRCEDANLALFTRRWRGVVPPDVVQLPDGRSAPVGLVVPDGHDRAERLASWTAARADLARQVDAMLATERAGAA